MSHLSGKSAARSSPFTIHHHLRIRQIQWSKHHVRLLHPSCKAHTRAMVGKHERQERYFMCTQFAVVGHRQNPAGHLQLTCQHASAYNCGLHTAKELRQNNLYTNCYVARPTRTTTMLHYTTPRTGVQRDRLRADRFSAARRNIGKLRIQTAVPKRTQSC